MLSSRSFPIPRGEYDATQVRARDDQNRNRESSQKQHLLDAATAASRTLEPLGTEIRLKPFARPNLVRLVPGQLLHCELETIPGGLGGHTGPQPPIHLRSAVPIGLESRSEIEIVDLIDRQPDLLVSFLSQSGITWRGNADHNGRSIVDPYCFSDDIRVASEACHPELVS